MKRIKQTQPGVQKPNLSSLPPFKLAPTMWAFRHNSRIKQGQGVCQRSCMIGLVNATHMENCKSGMMPHAMPQTYPNGAISWVGGGGVDKSATDLSLTRFCAIFSVRIHQKFSPTILSLFCTIHVEVFQWRRSQECPWPFLGQVLRTNSPCRPQVFTLSWVMEASIRRLMIWETDFSAGMCCPFCCSASAGYKILCPKDPDFYTPLGLNCKRAAHPSAGAVQRSISHNALSASQCIT